MFDYTDLYDPDEGYDSIISDETLRYIKKYVTNKSTILDIGCATGRISQSFATSNEIHLLDISEKYLNIASKRIPNAHIFLGNFLDLEINSKFDNIFILNNIQEQSDLKIFLNKAIDLLSPEGKLFISYPNSQSLHRIVGVIENKLSDLNEVSTKSSGLGTLSMINELELLEIIAKKNLKLIREKGICLKPYKNLTMESLEKEIVDKLNKSIDMFENYAAINLKIFQQIR